MNPYTAVVSQALFPLHERLKGHTTIVVHRELERSQWLSPPELQALQVERLRHFLQDIAQHVPWYRECFDALGFDPARLQSIEDLQSLPLLDKATIRQAGDALRSDKGRALQRFNTGGSSGEPLIFYLGKERVSHDVAAKRRATRWWGVDIGDREAVVWGSPIELGAQDRVRQWRDQLFRSHLIPAFDMSPAKLDQYIADLRRQRPAMVFGYPSSIALIASAAQQRGIALNDLGVKVVFVTSERLYEHQRETIESVFKAPVANGYGGRDAGFIAHQCPEGSLHITAEDIVVEIVDGAGKVLPPGERGEIVVTHMATSDFPFVRYRTGDIGVLSDTPCACGRGLPVLAEVMGRTTDFVQASDGTVMHGLALIYVLRDMPEVAEFKIVQESLSLTRVEVVTGPGWCDAVADKVRADFRERLGQSVEVSVDPVGSITPEASGKTRYVVSRVPLPGAANETGNMEQSRSQNQ